MISAEVQIGRTKKARKRRLGPCFCSGHRSAHIRGVRRECDADLGDLWMQRGRESLARTLRGVTPADRVILEFLASSRAQWMSPSTNLYAEVRAAWRDRPARPAGPCGCLRVGASREESTGTGNNGRSKPDTLADGARSTPDFTLNHSMGSHSHHGQSSLEQRRVTEQERRYRT